MLAFSFGLLLILLGLLLLLPALIRSANVHIVKIRPDSANGHSRRAVCELPLALGNCTRKFTRFYWDTSREHCYKFFYSGCGGNGNRFLSRHQCKRRCSSKFRQKHKKTRISARISIRQREEAGEECLGNCTNRVCLHGTCQCRKGFELVGRECIDINECHWAKCADNARCVNFAGSFRCECRSGFAGSGFSCTEKRSVCAQMFDRRYEHQCQPEQGWESRWHFHLHSGKCRQFWYGGCQFGESLNFFPDKQSCEAICGSYSHEEFMADQFGSLWPSLLPSSPPPPAPSASPCLEPFNQSLRKPCADGIWKRRYFYDASALRCRVFWMDASCPRPNKQQTNSLNRNLFSRLSSCKRACEGRTDYGVQRWGGGKNGMDGGGGGTPGVIQASFLREKGGQGGREREDCTETALADSLWTLDSAKAKKQRLAKLKAKLKAERARAKERGGGGTSPACLDKFDWNLTKSCGNGPWQVQFFFDHRLAKCRHFWNNGCPGSTKNHFWDEKTCQRMCEEGGGGALAGDGEELAVKTLESVCAEPFDENYRRACHNGKGWTRKWFFDQRTGFCSYFWYDGCKGQSRNIFDGLKECMDTCWGGKNDSSKPRTGEPTRKGQFAYFGSGEEETANSMGFWAFRKNYLRSEEMSLDELECTDFRYNASGKARLSAFLCLLEEGGGCQLTVLLASNGAEKCHRGRPWLRGKHSYAWFFTLERNPSLVSGMGENGQKRSGSGLLNLHQKAHNSTSSAIVPIEPFGQQNETIAWIDLLEMDKHCHHTC